MEPNARSAASRARWGPALRPARWALRGGLAALLVSAALAAPARELVLEPGTYTLESQMVMPHLEQMRRVKSQEQRCLESGEPEALFPVLRQPSFIGCTLGFESRHDERLDYVLVCQSARVATGTARIERVRDSLVGTLEVKMGGKNMTFSQRIEATRTGPCQALQKVGDDPPTP